MEYVNYDEYKKFIAEVRSYCRLTVTNHNVTIESGIHIGYVAGYKEGKGYMIDKELLA